MPAKSKPSRNLYLVDDVTPETYLKFSRRLALLEKSYPKGIVVDLELYSSGGEAYTALAFSSRILNSSLKIRITARALVASAAVLILASGHHRRMTRNSWVMVHEDSGEMSGKTADLEKAALHIRRLETQWNRLLGDLTTTPEYEWETLHSEETYIDAERCLALGLVDELI